MAAGAVIGALRVNLGIDSAQFSRGLTQAEKRAEAFGRRVGTAIRAGVIAIGAAGAALAVAMRGAINEADQLGKMAQSIGIPVDELSKLKHAADLSGVSIEVLSKGMARLARNTVEGAQGLQTPIRAFAALGIEIRNADGSLKTVSQILPEIADRFARLRDGPEKTALAMQLLGRAGADLIPMLNAGGAGLRAMMEEAEQLGLVIDTKTAKAAEAFNDNLTRLMRVKDGIVTQITARMLPALESLSQVMIDAAKNSALLEETASVLTTTLRSLATAGTIVGAIFKSVGEAIGGTLATLGRLLQGEFQKALNTFNAASTDLRDNVTGTLSTIDKIWADTAASAGASTLNLATTTVTAGDLMITTADKVTKAERDMARQIIDNANSTSLAYDQMVQRVEQVGQTVQSSLSSAFDSIVEGTFNAREAIGGLLKDLGRLAVNTLFQSLVGRAVGGLTGQIVSAGIPGFADGGRFKVDGAGGIDSQLVAFRASPGETVSVSKDGANDGGSVKVTVEAAPSPYFDLRVRQISGDVAERTAAAGIAASDRAKSRREATHG